MIRIDGWTYLLLALWLLTLPLNWLLAAAVAAAWHEISHALALLACGGRVICLEVTGGGARMLTSPLGRWKTFLCALAGPVGSGLLLLFAPWIPRVSLCALGQGAFNLLPIYPLDGGRAMECLFPGWRRRGEKIFLGATLLVAVLGAGFAHWGPIPALALTLAALRRKNPCKNSRSGVQ